MGRVLPVVILVLSLCGCKPDGQRQGAGVIPAADAPARPNELTSAPISSLRAEYSVPMDVSGTQPQWTLKIRPGGLALIRPDHLEAVAVNPGPQIRGEVATWQAPAAGKSGALNVTLKPGRCSNGMSDKELPYQATVEVGGETLMGCAAPASG